MVYPTERESRCDEIGAAWAGDKRRLCRACFLSEWYADVVVLEALFHIVGNGFIRSVITAVHIHGRDESFPYKSFSVLCHSEGTYAVAEYLLPIMRFAPLVASLLGRNDRLQ